MTSGNGHDSDVTPADPPTLPENIPAIRAIAPLVIQLAALNENLALHVHELRIARVPVPESVTAKRLFDAFSTLVGIGTAGKKAFAK